MKEYEQHLKDAIHYGKTQWHNYSQAHLGYAKDEDASKFNYESLSDEDKRLWRLFVFEKLTISIGVEITKIIPGWISSQIDPRLAYDKCLMLASAKRMAKHYEIAGVKKERFMIKVPSTWEGLCVAKELESYGIHVNMTLMFSFAQAIAAVNAGATMISPYVARISDWWVANANNGQKYSLDENPGLKKVDHVWRYFKHFNLKPVILVANCRFADEVLHLSGCDRHTIGPSVLDDLQSRKGVEVPRKCKLEDVEKHEYKEIKVPDEKTFRWMLNEDAAAYEKLADGLRKFAIELEKMDKLTEKHL